MQISTALAARLQSSVKLACRSTNTVEEAVEAAETSKSFRRQSPQVNRLPSRLAPAAQPVA